MYSKYFASSNRARLLLSADTNQVVKALLIAGGIDIVVDVVAGIGHEVEVDIMKEDVEGYCRDRYWY